MTRGLAELRTTKPPATGGSAMGTAVDESPPAAPLPCTQAVTILESIPGVDRRGAELLVAEWGIEMARLGTAARLTAWTGVAPGHDESAGSNGRARPARAIAPCGP